MLLSGSLISPMRAAASRARKTARSRLSPLEPHSITGQESTIRLGLWSPAELAGIVLLFPGTRRSLHLAGVVLRMIAQHSLHSPPIVIRLPLPLRQLPGFTVEQTQHPPDF